MPLGTINITPDGEDESVSFSVGDANDWLDEIEATGGFRAIRFADAEDAANWLYEFNGQSFGGLVVFDDATYGVFVFDTSE